MDELDESFAQTVQRAVATPRQSESTAAPTIDVSGVTLTACLDSQDQNKTFRTRLVLAWLLSNAALALSVQTLNGLDQTQALVNACLPAGFDQYSGQEIKVNGTCIDMAVQASQSGLQGKQQVRYFRRSGGVSDHGRYTSSTSYG